VPEVCIRAIATTYHLQLNGRLFKLAFHDADIDTDILADILVRIAARTSSLPQEQLQEIARVGRVGEDPRKEVGVGVVECEL